MHRHDIAQSDSELVIIRLCVELTMFIGGNVAEVGVYRGGSADYIYSLLNFGNKLFLFDTFSGFPELTEHDPKAWEKDEFNWKTLLPDIYEKVKEHFKDKNVKIVKGDFPKSVENDEEVNNSTFCFVHLDADAYLPTLNSLNYFYPKMVKGGIILLHDYNHQDTPVRLVCDEFFKDKLEKVINTPTSQGFIIKQ
jgi:hypothetical protein